MQGMFWLSSFVWCVLANQVYMPATTRPATRTGPPKAKTTQPDFNLILQGKRPQEGEARPRPTPTLPAKFQVGDVIPWARPTMPGPTPIGGPVKLAACATTSSQILAVPTVQAGAAVANMMAARTQAPQAAVVQQIVVVHQL